MLNGFFVSRLPAPQRGTYISTGRITPRFGWLGWTARLVSAERSASMHLPSGTGGTLHVWVAVIHGKTAR